MTPCELFLPEHDIALTLMPGYGITEPLIATTPGGSAMDRPSFDMVRVIDGAALVTVNLRQEDGVDCQIGLAGDLMCLTDAITEADSIAVAFLLGSLGFATMAGQTDALDEYAPSMEPGVLQGVWFADLDTPDAPDHEALFMMIALFQDAGDDAVFGYFITSPDVGPLPAVSGDVTGRLMDDTLSLTLAAADGTALLTFSGTASGDITYSGDVSVAADKGDAVGTRLSRIAGPGEDWSGPAWMTVHTDGADNAFPPENAAPGDLQGDDRALADVMDALMNAMAGAGADPAHAQTAASPTLAPLGAQTVDLQGIPADALIEMVVPFQKIRP